MRTYIVTLNISFPSCNPRLKSAHFNNYAPVLEIHINDDAPPNNRIQYNSVILFFYILGKFSFPSIKFIN